MMIGNVFDHDDYKTFLQEACGGTQRRTGLKSELARAMNCQPTYISQIFRGKAHLSLEQAEAVSRFFEFTREERRYFMLLVQCERAGTASLKRLFEEDLRELREKRLTLTERLGRHDSLAEVDQSLYYSSWHYAAVHIALTIPGLRSPAALAQFFNAPEAKIREVIDFLLRTGLAELNEQGELTTGTKSIRLGNDSPNILRHHTNWRLYAIESLEREASSDLHYSAVVSLSYRDALQVKDRLLEHLKEILTTIKASAEEELCVLNIDFFNANRRE